MTRSRPSSPFPFARSWRAPGRGRAVALAAALVLLTGCGGGAAQPVAEAPIPEGLGEVTIAEDGVQEVTLQTQDDYVFTPDTFTVAPGPVRLTLVNVAEGMPHNLEFTDEELPEPIDAGISMLAAGEEKTIEFEVSTPGEYPFACTFHLQLGQVGTMTVSG
ncbi:plastocyanin/azurin family copper-binding protein [Blastococcus sp. BMG 814]|uniref:Plastocyanin/azurin family copper-binding protein n=1 Tax=Blastococcus carthaginiensis TaxID=3050034 RepID=A0ABT9IEV5_9ACTN|nr:plastocyanin/azurin family copper-binding protein [Blastococcus carthaginiensis]MDP5184091.1 plastocyanin/azurin family copper-binding protein [Blastococcus carthaginiensis]